MDVDPLPPPLLASPPAGPAQQEAEKAQEEIAAGAQEISMAIASSQIVDLKDFPNDFKSVKESPGYPKFAGHLNMEQAVQEHRGRDQKPFLIKTSKRGKRGNQKAQVFSHTPAVVAFSNATRSNVFGKISTQLPPESLITVAYFPSTQTPSIHLKLLHAKSKHRHVLIEAFIYGNSIEMSQDPEQNASLHSLEMDVGPSLKTEYISPKVLNDESTGVAAAHSAGELWLTCIDINPSRPTDRPEEEQPGLSSSRLAALPFEDDIVTDDQSPEMIQSMSTERDSGIKFFGIAAKDLKHIRETTERDFETGLNDVEKIIWWLAQPSFQMHIYSWTPSESVDTAKEFIKYFRPLMKISMDHGPYWFYRLEAQSTKKFSDRDFPYKSLPVPRWLVNRWQIGLNEDNIPIPGTEIPLHWTNFRLPTEAPSSDAKMFQYQLAVTREREEHQRRIRESRLETDFNIVTKFKKFSGQPNKFLVAIWLKGHDPMATPSKLPSLESRISISVRIGKKDVVFNGMTCEDFFNVRCHIFACVRGVGNTSALKEDIRYRGFITLVDDEVPTSRILNGLYLCAQPKKANKGVDVGALLGFHEPMITHADCLAQEFGQKKEMCNRFQTVMSRIQLDKNQRSAAMSAMSSATGVIALWGPPGTGKTTTNVAMGEALAQCGKVVGHTTPSKIARDVAMNNFLSVTELADDQIVRFNGGHQVGPFQMDQDGAEQRPEDQELINEVWELYERREMTGFDDQLAGYDFETQLDKFVESVRSSPTHELHSMAKEYFQKKKELSEAKVTGLDTRSMKELRDVVDKLRKLTFTEAYFKSRVKIIFLTESQCAADPIFLYAKVQCLLVDEAGMSTIPKLAVPLGVFRESLELLILSGDHKQQQPVVFSSQSNEFGDLLRHSLLQKLHESGDNRIHMLRNSYRLTPDVGAWNSHRFYGVALNCKNPGDEQLWNTINSAISTHAPFFVAQKPLPRRIAVDVSSSLLHSREVYSSQKNETSQANDFEAEFVVQVILGLLKFEPGDPIGQRTIVPSDFLVITPYGGQRQLIVEKLAGAHKQGIRGQDGASLLSIPVATTAAAQGGEGRIVLVSLVANKPGAPRSLGFITSPAQLNVETSRAQEFLFLFGNFKGWVNLIRGRDPVFSNKNYNGDHGHFINLVHNIYEKNQVISCDDLCDSLNGITITDSTFLSTLDPGAPKEQGTKKRKHADMDGPTTAPEGSGLLDQFEQQSLAASASEQDQQPVKKKSRKSRKRKERDAKGRQDGQSDQAA